MYNEGQGKPVGPTGELDTLAHVSDKPIGVGTTMTQNMADRLDREQEVRLPEPMLQRSSDAPIDSAWSILKALSREDLEMAARTGGIPTTAARQKAIDDDPYSRLGSMPDTMRPSSMAEQMPQQIHEPRFSDQRREQEGIQQEYNEAMFPDEEAEHRRINAPTPVSMPSTIDPNRQFLEQRLQDMRYPMAQMRAAGHTPETNLPMRQMTQDHMKLQHRLGQRPMQQPGAPMPVGEAGDASMDDPSQMEHLGRELADDEEEGDY